MVKICDKCFFLPTGNYCHKSKTLLSRRYCYCSSYSIDGLTTAERQIAHYRSRKEFYDQKPEEAGKDKTDSDGQVTRQDGEAD